MKFTSPRAKARPRKWFFIEMFTRDISLVDCILDLIDNSIDSLIRTQNIDLDSSLLKESPQAVKRKRSHLPTVTVNYSKAAFSVHDNCGGISYKEAKNEVFNFGHGPDYHARESGKKLGVYGIGLKRALFKLGSLFTMTSRTVKNGFSTSINVDEWAKKDNKLEDWSFPIKRVTKAKKKKNAGTQIYIKDLREDVKIAIEDGMFFSSLYDAIAKVYALFLERYVRIIVNNKIVNPISMPLGGSEEVTPAYKQIRYDDVTVNIFASIASRDSQKEWPVDQAGWYVGCNGRLVVIADKTDLTGWGGGDLPEFHGGKYRGFVGLALFQSEDPLKLPWNTTKKGLNKESIAYQKVRRHMTALARPILTFLNKMYAKELIEEAPQRQIADAVKQVEISTLASKQETSFKAESKTRRPEKTTIRVQYNAEKTDIEKIRKHNRRPEMSFREIGEMTFKYYLKGEGIL